MRVLLADRDEVYASVLSNLLERRTTCTVVARARTADELVTFARRLNPDLVLMNLDLPELRLGEAIRSLKALVSPPRVVIISTYVESEYGRWALDAGADAFVPKHRIEEDLMPLVRREHAISS